MSILCSYLNGGIAPECLMLILENIAELIADALRVTDALIDITVRVSVNPIVDTAVCYIVAKLDCKCSVD